MYTPDKFKIVILGVLSVNLTRTYSVICKKLSKDLWFLAQDIEKTHPKAKNFLIVPQCGDLFTARTELKKRLLADSAISSPKYFLFLYQKSYTWKLPSINAYLNKNKKNQITVPNSLGWEPKKQVQIYQTVLSLSMILKNQDGF